MAKTKTNITENFEENIKNYGQKIEHIESFVDAVRRFPGRRVHAWLNQKW